MGLVDASVAHQRRIRTLFTELEAKEKSYEEAESEEADDDANPIVQVIQTTKVLKIKQQKNVASETAAVLPQERV